MDPTAFGCTGSDLASRAARELPASSDGLSSGGRWSRTTQTVHSDFAPSPVNLLELSPVGFHNHVIHSRADALDSTQFQRRPVHSGEMVTLHGKAVALNGETPVPTDDVLMLTGNAALPPGTLALLTDRACMWIPKAAGLPSGTAMVPLAFAAAHQAGRDPRGVPA